MGPPYPLGREGDPPVPETGLLDLEADLKKIPDVLGCVILVKADGSSGEIQAFARVDADLEALKAQILSLVDRAGFADKLRVVQVFELEAESLFGDRQTLERAAELAEQEARARGPLEPAGAQIDLETPVLEWGHRPWRGLEGRPLVQRVVLSATTATSEAEVALTGPAETEVVGLASGEKTAHGLTVVAQATLDACRRLVEGFEAEVRGASLVTVVGEEAVVVLVRLAGDLDLMGSALLRRASSSEAAVRATLDAVNRLLLRRS